MIIVRFLFARTSVEAQNRKRSQYKEMGNEDRTKGRLGGYEKKGIELQPRLLCLFCKES